MIPENKNGIDYERLGKSHDWSINDNEWLRDRKNRGL